MFDNTVLVFSKQCLLFSLLENGQVHRQNENNMFWYRSSCGAVQTYPFSGSKSLLLMKSWIKSRENIRQHFNSKWRMRKNSKAKSDNYSCLSKIVLSRKFFGGTSWIHQKTRQNEPRGTIWIVQMILEFSCILYLERLKILIRSEILRQVKTKGNKATNVILLKSFISIIFS